MTPPHRLLVILGPTGSGKSALAVHIAQKFGGEVVCCDSTQVYKHFNIGTGKLRADEQQSIPHHLVDLAEPEEVFTAGDYRRIAEQTISHIDARSKLPILTVGTGLYLRALLEGLDDLPERSEDLRERLRQRAAERGCEYLHRILRRRDPAGAARIASQDLQKLIRAIEVCLLTGKPASDLQGKNRVGLRGFSITKIGLLPPREALYAQIDTRVCNMFASGWVDEVRGLMQRQIPPTAKPFTFLGYAQIREHILSGRLLDDVTPEIQQASRRYAKRQITWFRRERDVHWLGGFGKDQCIQGDATKFVTESCGL